MSECAKKQIFLYADFGADYRTLKETIEQTLPEFELVLVKRDDLLDEALFNPEKVAAFFLPGAGSNGQYDVRLGLDGFAAIRNYVEDGGLFYGFCAGAYYASSRLEWRLDCEEKKRIKEPSLRFFNGIARGPIRQIMERHDREWSWTEAVATNCFITPERGKPRTIKALYWGGPEFLNIDESDKNLRVIARFSNVDKRPPCLLERRIGKGRAILSCIHPEVSPKQLVPFTVGRHNRVEEIKRLITEITPYEPFREALWDQIVAPIRDQLKPQRAPAITPQSRP